MPRMHRQVSRSAAALRHALRKRGGALPQFAMDDDAPPSSVWHRDRCQQGLTFPALGGALPRLGRRRLTAVSTGGIPNTWYLLLMFVMLELTSSTNVEGQLWLTDRIPSGSVHFLPFMGDTTAVIAFPVCRIWLLRRRLTSQGYVHRVCTARLNYRQERAHPEENNFAVRVT